MSHFGMWTILWNSVWCQKAVGSLASRWWKLRPSLLRSIWAIAHWPQHCWFHAFNARSRSEPVEFMHDLHIAEINRPGAIFLSLIFSKFCIQLALQRSTVWYIDVLIRSFKVIEIDTNRKPVWDFLSFFHRKYVPIFYCYSEIWRHICRKSRFLHNRPYSTPSLLFSDSVGIRADLCMQEN